MLEEDCKKTEQVNATQPVCTYFSKHLCFEKSGGKVLTRVTRGNLPSNVLYVSDLIETTRSSSKGKLY